MVKWHIEAQPERGNPRVDAEGDPENLGGMVVYVSNGHVRQEVSRVAFVRRASKNPGTPYDEQLRSEVAKARESVRLLNEQLAGEGELL